MERVICSQRISCSACAQATDCPITVRATVIATRNLSATRVTRNLKIEEIKGVEIVKQVSKEANDATD
jgi:hypothetical protein